MTREEAKEILNALTWVQGGPDREETITAISMAIEALSADAAHGKWIPCSEELPEYRKTVLISTYWGVRVACLDSVKEDGTDDYWDMFLDDSIARPMYVYAWMPLPEPYKGGDTE